MSTPQTSDEIRQAFLDFYHEMGHEVVDSSPLVPAGNNTLLFTNAGMNQFADALLGLEQRPYRRATTSQKVMRVSGKHNDLDNVGPSPRHHTFFEMLGNFSFGDYFKPQAIEFAWMFLTDVLKLPPERLWVTVYTTDDDAAQLWTKHVAPDRILRFEEENFWEMGDTGPCGPCSEIFYYGGPLEEQDGAAGVNVSDDYLEVWNLVFMQYDRASDGTLTPLPAQSIDTGMGLERITQVVQGGTSNYETDLFQPILARLQELLGDTDERRAAEFARYRAIADHARAATFLISDGVLPSNEGRGYVLRLIMRRALRFGWQLGLKRPFLSEVAQAVVDKMGTHYKELRGRAPFILEAIRKEEAAFQRTLERGLGLLDEIMARLRKRGAGEIPGREAFSLYDTFGFPLDLTKDIARENGFTVDQAGYDEAMAEQKRRGRESGTFNVDEWAQSYRRMSDVLPRSAFLGYDAGQLAEVSVQVVSIINPVTGERLEQAAEGSEVELLLDRTPFYAESGGQVADTGTVVTEYGRALVTDVQRPIPGVVAHRATIVSGTIRRGESARATVDVARRADVMRNHTATHLLHRALHEVLGEHATQRGSLVGPDYLRFDFNHLSGVSEEELARVESLVNAQVRADLKVGAREMALDDAKRLGAMSLFGEKYGDVVRVVSVGDNYSRELCGGTHLRHTGEIGTFLITGEGSVSSGVRRITALTGRAAEQTVREQRTLLRSLGKRLDAPQPDQIEARVERLQQELAESRRLLDRLQRERAREQVTAMVERAATIGGVRVLAEQVQASSAEDLRGMADFLRDRLGSAVVVLGATVDDKPIIVAAATKDAIGRGAHAGKLAREVAAGVGGSGGGRPDMAQAGGKDATKLPEVLAMVPMLVRQQLGVSG